MKQTLTYIRALVWTLIVVSLAYIAQRLQQIHFAQCRNYTPKHMQLGPIRARKHKVNAREKTLSNPIPTTPLSSWILSCVFFCCCCWKSSLFLSHAQHSPLNIFNFDAHINTVLSYMQNNYSMHDLWLWHAVLILTVWPCMHVCMWCL